METIYDAEDDILEIRLSDKPIARETSQDWNITLSYDAEGKLVQVVVLDAKANGLLPVHDLRHAA
jgi:YD repeat-containing protein